MGFSVTLAGKTFTEASFEGQAYADETDGMPAALQKVVEHVAGFGISTATDSLTIGTGDQDLTVSADTPFALGMWVTIAETADPSINWMAGQITAWDSGTGAMTVDVTNIGGTGTVAVWTVSISGEKGSTGSTGTAGEVQNVDFQNGTPIYATGAGTANAQTLTLSPAITAYAAGQGFRFKAGATNTGAATLNVNGKGAKSIKKGNGTVALVAGDITSGQIIHVAYDGTNFQMIADRKLPAPVANKYGAMVVQNNADDGFDLITGQGTTGQLWVSNGSDALPTWQNRVSTFLSNIFRIQDSTDATKQLALNLTALDTATTRTMTMPNADVDLTNVRQATTSLTGFAELATDTEAFIGTDANRVLTPSNFGVNSLATNGYQKLAGGLILQWGFYNTTVAGTSTATFPVAFPTACLNVTGESVFTGALAASSVIIAGSLTATNFQFYQGSTSVDFYWFAIGY